MGAELLELYQELGQFVWDLFQQRAIESVLTRLTEQNALLDEGSKNRALELTQARMSEIKPSIAQTLAEIHANPEAPGRPFLRQLRSTLG
jgi:hypothetical protein